jgi:hypothetical protein
MIQSPERNSDDGLSSSITTVPSSDDKLLERHEGSPQDCWKCGTMKTEKNKKRCGFCKHYESLKELRDCVRCGLKNVCGRCCYTLHERWTLCRVCEYEEHKESKLFIHKDFKEEVVMRITELKKKFDNERTPNIDEWKKEKKWFLKHSVAQPPYYKVYTHKRRRYRFPRSHE